MSGAQDTFRGDPCGVENCRSTRYHLDTDGRTYCHRGHQVEGEILTQLEEFGVGGSQRPGTARKSRRKENQEREKVSLTLDGVEAVELCLQCFQLVLRKQVKWLCEVKGCPQDLEPLVFDLWAIRLEMLRDILDDPNEDGAVQMFSTQMTDTEASDEERSRSRPARATFHKKAPRLTESLSILYIALVLMRLPVCAGDMRGWVLNEDFAFLRAINAIPLSMRQRLPTEMKFTFQPRIGLGELEKLHMTTQDVVGALHRSSGIATPPINHKLLLVKWVSHLALPLEVFNGVDRLKNLLHLDFHFAVDKRYTQISEHPEIRLVSLLIVVTKLFYPFDGDVRHPRTATEPAALAMNWEAWNEDRTKANIEPLGEPQSSHEQFLDTTEHDVLSMSDRDMDKYLDWFGRTWTDKEEPQGLDADFRNAMLQMFPIGATGNDGEDPAEPMDEEARDRVERLKLVQGSLMIRAPLPNQEKHLESGQPYLRPGEQYRHFRTVDEVPSKAMPFLVAAADLVNLSVESLLVAVFQLERRLQRWAYKDRKERSAESGERASAVATDSDLMDTG